MKPPTAAPPVAGLVSVIIPSHNRAVFLSQAIGSCALQTWPSFEIIVVDDGSDEDVEGAVFRARTRYGLASDRVIYVRQEQRGGAAARNVGFTRASGEFLQYLDSDDLLHPDKLTIHAARLAAKPDLDMVFGLDELFKDVPGDTRVLWNVPRRVDCPDALDRYLLEDAVWQTGSPLWRRRAIERIVHTAGGWDERLTCWQDWQFHVGALCAGIRYECVGEVLIYIREHEGPRASRSASVACQRSCFDAGRVAHHNLVQAGLLDGKRNDLLLRYFERHLAVVAGLDEDDGSGGSRQLRRDMIAFMRPLARSGKRRAALTAMAWFSRTPLLRPMLEFYRRSPWYGPVFQPFRAVIRGDFLQDAPAALRETADLFPGSEAYWEARYAGGGDSGVGSYARFAEFKAEVLNAFVSARRVEHVIEFGCGDGNQLQLATYANYMGFDVSLAAVARCVGLFAQDRTRSFREMSSYAGEQADLALSLDVVYHLVEDDVFDSYMRTLFGAATHYVIIYSSNTDDNGGHDGRHVRHRMFTRWIEEHAEGWRLLERIPNRYPYRGDHRTGSFADFFIFARLPDHEE
jgi:hypothetical protein